MQISRTVDTFDLIAAPDRIGPEYGFIALFLIIGVGMLLAAFALLRLTSGKRSETLGRFRRTGWFMLPFSVIWLGFVSWMSVGDIHSARMARGDVLSGDYQTLEGCLQYFRAGAAHPGKGIGGDERWAVNGHPFEYGANEARFAYHKVEPLGGIVHSTSKVRVSFTRDTFVDRDDIVRLEIDQKACPPAADAPDL